MSAVSVNPFSLQSIEAEGHDRVDIGLPGVQGALVDAVASCTKVNARLVVVLMSGSSVDISALLADKRVHAIMWVGYPGMMGAQATLDVLTGRVSPAGRVPITFFPSEFVNQVEMTNMNMRPGLLKG